jgi:DDE superfamily endonuclease
MSNRGFGLTPIQVREFAFEIAERNRLQNRFNAEARKAGQDWFKSFLEINPEVSVRAPEATSIGHLSSFNKPQVDRFFQLLGEVMTTHNFSASRVFNCDESGLPTVPTKLQKVVHLKGARRVPKVTSAECGTNVTVVCSMNAAGFYVPPVFIFPRKRFSSEQLVGAPPDSDGFCNGLGWMTTEMFIQYLKHFSKHVRPTKADPVLLIVDNHASHVSLEAVDLCREHCIVLLSLPPITLHTSSSAARCQLLRVTENLLQPAV